jgi:PIN domain nuclease of toxin-antitoxin system
MGKFPQGGYLVIRATIDTHAIIGYIFADTRLSINARNFIEQIAADGAKIALASIPLAEIIYLTEKGRLPSTFECLLQALDSNNSLLVEIPFHREIAQSLRLVERTKVPDLPDRIIAATSLHLGVPLISRDRKIQLSSINTKYLHKINCIFYY